MTEFRFNPEKTMVENYNDNETLMYQQVEEIFSDKLIQNNPGIVKEIITLITMKGIINAQMGGELVNILKLNGIKYNTKNLNDMREFDRHLINCLDNVYTAIEEIAEEITGEPISDQE